MNETTTFLGTTSTAILSGYSGTYGDSLATPLNLGSVLTYSNGSDYNSLSTLTLTNQNNMVKQVKVAVFTVERNDKNEIVSSKFVKEFWVENKNGSSIVLAAAKQLDKDYDPDTTIIREITSITF